MEKITLQTLIQRNPEMVTSNIDGEIVMMSIENGEYYGLDEIGSRIWELLETPISADKLISCLLIEFDVEEVVCKTDTLDFLNDMFEKKLVFIR
jgi:hypothetical protein